MQAVKVRREQYWRPLSPTLRPGWTQTLATHRTRLSASVPMAISTGANPKASKGDIAVHNKPTAEVEISWRCR